MKHLKFRITFDHGNHDMIEVYARTIASGYRKALALAIKRTFRSEQIAAIEFWETIS